MASILLCPITSGWFRNLQLFAHLESATSEIPYLLATVWVGSDQLPRRDARDRIAPARMGRGSGRRCLGTPTAVQSKPKARELWFARRYVLPHSRYPQKFTNTALTVRFFRSRPMSSTVTSGSIR